MGSSSWWSTLNQYQASSLNGIVNSLAVLNPYSSSSAAIISNTSANSTFVTIFNQFGVTLDFNKSDDSRLISSVIASGPTSWTSGYSACPAPLTSCSAMMRMPTYNSYVLLTSDDINVINVGSTGDKGTMGKGLYGYVSSKIPPYFQSAYLTLFF